MNLSIERPKQYVVCWGDQANLYNREVRNPENRGMRVDLSIPCLLSDDFKTENLCMCRTNKSADRDCLCHSLALNEQAITISSLYSNVANKSQMN
jgi:hypothetical protein